MCEASGEVGRASLCEKANHLPCDVPVNDEARSESGAGLFGYLGLSSYAPQLAQDAASDFHPLSVSDEFLVRWTWFS